MAERANPTIVEVAASHVSFLSQPEAATQLILQAIEATSRSAAVCGVTAIRRPPASPMPGGAGSPVTRFEPRARCWSAPVHISST